MLEFSTDDLDPKDRFDQWREVRGKGLFGVTIELPPERRLGFHGMFRAWMVGTAVSSEMKASAYEVSRTEADIARVAGNSLCLALQVRGQGVLDAGRDRLAHVGEGDMVINYSDLAYAARPRGDSGFHYRLLKIPLDDELTLGRSAHDLHATKPVGDIKVSSAFRALFQGLTCGRYPLSDPQSDIAHVTRLALAARGRLSGAMPEVRGAIRAGLRHAALAQMDQRLHRPDLSPATVAGSLGISVRSLHLLFEESEQTFGRTLARMRLSMARKLLVEFRGLTITQIAYACGFDSLATFYRLFNAVYGMAPGEARSSQSLH
ncbi:UNVERIFIED_ORG: AraC-like DNA-binding protein [Shinella zoogloeoides]|nr:AraC-like DNA-binding protein [Shinella zoogloeoides]